MSQNKDPNVEELQALSQPSSDRQLHYHMRSKKPLTVDLNGANIVLDEITKISLSRITFQRLIFISSLYRKLSLIRKFESNFFKSNAPLKGWYQRVCGPVLRCLIQCCCKDIKMFQSRWGNPFSHSEFHLKCSGDPCGYQSTPTVSLQPNQITEPVAQCNVTSGKSYLKVATIQTQPQDGCRLTALEGRLRKEYLHSLLNFDMGDITDYNSLCMFLVVFVSPFISLFHSFF